MPFSTAVDPPLACAGSPVVLRAEDDPFDAVQPADLRVLFAPSGIPAAIEDGKGCTRKSAPRAMRP